MQKNSTDKKSHKFQAEIRQLLNIMINSVYSNNEIFLRELISNASDALDKLRFKALTESELLKDEETLEIWIELNKKERTIAVKDNGIGMSYKEVIDNIGKIAASGSRSFFEKLSKEKSNEKKLELIGQFGVGFYSVFMVAEKVTLFTKSPYSKTGVKWESTGDGTYTIEKIDREVRGTEVIIKLKEDSELEKFLESYTIQHLVKKHSDYIRYPIKMEIVVKEFPKDSEGKPITSAEPVEKKEVRVLNSMMPLWEKNRKEIKQEEYNEFYKQMFHDWNSPFAVLHTKGEGLVDFSALLFIPSKIPAGYFMENFEKGLKLFSKRVFIMDNCRELLPDWLGFVKGIVDSQDFSLNISRELLQHTRQLKTIGKHLEKKILATLEDSLKNDRKKYMEFFKEFGTVLKNGIYTDFEARDKLTNLLIFLTTKSKDEFITLDEYVDRMKEDQKYIYYFVCECKENIENFPQIEVFVQKDIEVLLLFDKIDEFVLETLQSYKDKKFKSVTRADVDISEIDKEKFEKMEKEAENVLQAVKDVLKDKVKDVKLSKRLKSSPVCLVSGNTGISVTMEKVLSEFNKNLFIKAEKILELNPEHRIFNTLKRIYEKEQKSEKFGKLCNILYCQALLIEGLSLENPVEFARDVSSLLAEIEQEES